VKLYLDGVGSEAVHRWAREAEILATSRVAYPETLAALDERTLTTRHQTGERTSV
jgi:hypothetical protein